MKVWIYQAKWTFGEIYEQNLIMEKLIQWWWIVFVPTLPFYRTDFKILFSFQNYNPDLNGLRSQDLLLWILLLLILCGLLDHDKEVNIISSFMSEHIQVFY